MDGPDLKPVPRAEAPVVLGVIQQTQSALLGVLFSVGVVLPVLVTVITVPIVTGVGFLLITANASGNRAGLGADVPVLIIDVDGVSVLGVHSGGPGTGGANSMAGTIRVAVAAGPHTVSLRMSQELAGGSFVIDPVLLPLTNSASLVVMESNG